HLDQRRGGRTFDEVARRTSETEGRETGERYPFGHGSARLGKSGPDTWIKHQQTVACSLWVALSTTLRATRTPPAQSTRPSSTRGTGTRAWPRSVAPARRWRTSKPETARST